MSSVWIGDAPQQCDVCRAPITDVFYDASLPIYGGTWGNVDERCFKECSCTLGVGRGQRYERKPDGRFHCTAGGRVSKGE